MKRKPTPMLTIWFYLTEYSTKHFATKAESEDARQSDKSSITEVGSHVFWNKGDVLSFFKKHVNI